MKKLKRTGKQLGPQELRDQRKLSALFTLDANSKMSQVHARRMIGEKVTLGSTKLADFRIPIDLATIYAKALRDLASQVQTLLLKALGI